MSMPSRKALVLLAVTLLIIWAWWFLSDEALNPATEAWLEENHERSKSEGLDYLLLMGLMAPANENPIEYARDLVKQVEADPELQVDYLLDLMRNSPCDIDDWSCWNRDDSPWIANALERNSHALNRWYSLPVHQDFGEEPLSWLFGLGVPVLDALEHLLTFQLIDAKRWEELDELALKALEHAGRMAASRPMDGNNLSLLIFEVIKQRSLDHMMEAIRLGAKPPPREVIGQHFGERLSIEDQLRAWAQREFLEFRNFRAILHRGFPDILLARKNRTLNRARACLAQSFALVDKAKLFDVMKAESELCGPEWRSWRNWRGDELIHLFFMAPENVACRVHVVAQRELLAEATLHAVLDYHLESQRLAAIGQANSFGPNAGAILKGEEVCFDLPTAACGEVCLSAPWPVNSPAQH
jgi:hypothetical protein